MHEPDEEERYPVEEDDDEFSDDPIDESNKENS